MVDTGSDPTVVVAPGEPAQLILDESARHHAELIVTGVARSELFGRRLLGATVDTLVRRADVPVLVVRGRARQPYARIVVATDFSAGSRQALEAAVRFFDPAAVTLFHAYKAATGGVLTRDQTRSGWESIARQDAERFLDAADIAEAGKRAIRVLVEEGDAEALLRDYAHATGVDLVVTGAPGRGPFLEMLLGSTAQRLVEGMPCDVLVVRSSRGTSEP
jgi:nucleotide-binding universal stress UspA family protein